VKRSASVRRGSERGVAVFVVVMAITLLTGVGLFTAHSAMMVDQASGYVRLARQTQYLGEYGTLTTAAELGGGAADEYVQKLEDSVNSATVRCSPNQGLADTHCFKFFNSELEGRTLAVTGTKLFEATAADGTPGSFGKDAATVGELRIELTELAKADRPVAGAEIGKNAYRKVTVSTTAQIRSGIAACGDAVNTTVGQQSMRAQLLIGPLTPSS
jgi:hypothetical protein